MAALLLATLAVGVEPDCATCTNFAMCRDGLETKACQECEIATIRENGECACADTDIKVPSCMLHPSDCDVCHLEALDSIDQSLHEEALRTAEEARVARAAADEAREAAGAADTNLRNAVGQVGRASTEVHDATAEREEAFEAWQRAQEAEEKERREQEETEDTRSDAESTRAQRHSEWETAASRARELEQVARNAADAAIRHAREVRAGSESHSEQASKLEEILELHVQTQVEERNAAQSEYETAEEHAREREQAFHDLRARIEEMETRIETARTESDRARTDASSARVRHDRERGEYTAAQAELERARVSITDSSSFTNMATGHKNSVQTEHNEGDGYAVLDNFSKQLTPCTSVNKVESEAQCYEASHGVQALFDLEEQVVEGNWDDKPPGCSVQLSASGGRRADTPIWNRDPVGCGDNCIPDFEYICRTEHAFDDRAP